MVLLNVNVGVLGHVDSGKTSLSKALSTVASTGAFDKNPESKRRGITLDLGFSSFCVDSVPAHLQNEASSYDKLQFTLVDCPGHASLIKTILSGSQIIDIMMLVVDVTKGFQTQTKECLVIGEITAKRMIVVLNKCDLLEPETRQDKIAKMQKKISKLLEQTKLSGSPIVALSANIGGGLSESFGQLDKSEGVQSLIETLSQYVENPRDRRMQLAQRPFIFAVDHCFNITGQGTILTGTVISGKISISDIIELPHLKVQKKIKSMQMFRQPVQVLVPGDRAGICIPQLDSNLMERGLVCQPGVVCTVFGCVLKNASKVAYFKQAVKSKQKFNVSISHEMALASITAFRTSKKGSELDFAAYFRGDQPVGQELLFLEELLPPSETKEFDQYLVLQFDHAICCPSWGLAIGSKLDIDSCSDVCRLAFSGEVAHVFQEAKFREHHLPKLPIFKRKVRMGQIDRVSSPRECIVKGLFKKETNWELFLNLHVQLEGYEANAVGALEETPALWSVPGVITGNFGQTGKCRVDLKEDLPEEVVIRYTANKKKTTTNETLPTESTRVR
ncbi:hypothetical protein Ciccas_008387, partial [Cichlidogyrus casuarinus]